MLADQSYQIIHHNLGKQFTVRQIKQAMLFTPPSPVSVLKADQWLTKVAFVYNFERRKLNRIN